MSSAFERPLVKGLIAASCLGLLLLAGLHGPVFTWVARGVLGLFAGGVLAVGVLQRRRQIEGSVASQRLKVLSRAHLTPRCAAALLQADGRVFLVVHGDGFAEISPAPPSLPALARRPKPRSRVAR